jgi:putative ABC transport system permease protein
MFDALSRDLKFAIRLTARQPLLTAAATLTIAFGVGANTAVLSVLQTVLLNPLGLRHADEVMVARVNLEKLQMHLAPDSGVEFRELHDMHDAFSAVAAVEARAWTMQANGEGVRLPGRAVTPEFFQVFGASPALGRFFNADDGAQSLVLSHAMWQTQFGGDRGVLGRAVVLDGLPYRVVGVAPKDFRFPVDAAAWSPLVLSNDRMRRGYNMTLLVAAHLRDGVTPAQARGRVDRYVAALKTSAGGADLVKIGYAIEVDPLSVYVAGELRRPLWLLWAAALVVMLTGCANVAGLLLTRGAGRRKEIAVRLSVGATRSQIVRQLLLESVVLGMLGGVAGIALAKFAIVLVTRAPIPGRTVLALVTLDARVLFYGMALATASALLFGLAPALQVLRDSQTAALARSRRRGFQDAFVIAQVAGSFVLVVVTGLLLRSLWNVEQIALGFDPRHITTAYVIRPKNDPTFQERLLAELKQTPGIESAALAYPVPFSEGGLTSGFAIIGRRHAANEPDWHGEAFFVTPDYFETLRIPLLRGRNLSADDTAKAPLVCLIDRTLAERFFPNEDPIGRKIAMYQGAAQIVGVVANSRSDGLEAVTRPTVYYSLPQIPFFPQRAAIVRSRIPAAGLIRQAVRRTNASVALFDVLTMEQRIGESLGIRRILSVLLAVFGGIGVLLATIGIYGVIAQLVAERTQEVGIRMALGARPSQILADFTARGLRAGAAGLLFGAAATAYAQKWIASFLYQVRGFDAATMASSAAGVLLVLLAAAWVPARRASKIDPQSALRHE